jgi:hypothetical protein
MHERVGIQSTSRRPRALPAPARVTALAAFVALVMAGVIAASCGGSSGKSGGSPGGDASSQDATPICGGSGEPCCSGTACNNGLACTVGTCSASIPADATLDSAGDVVIADVAEAADGTFTDVAAPSDGAVADAMGFDAVDDTIAADVGSDAGTCKSGTYAGTFQCTFAFASDAGVATSDAGDAGSLMITGNVSFRLTQAADGGPSFTSSGTFSGGAGTFFEISAVVDGTLDCDTGVFQGSLTNGMYSGFLFLNGTFSSPLYSQYNATTSSFVDGTWLLSVPREGTCPGTWTASYASDQ